jgi:thioesterase domain-containing protein
VTDEFFKLGGNSLLGVRLINVMNDRLGNYWRINHLFTHPTIKKLATFIKDTESSNETVVEIRPGGSRKFFFIYDGEGEVMLYRNLANRLPNEFTVFGIMPQSRTGIPQVHLSVEEMARECIMQMKRYQSEGPYYYGGLCAGGVISFEMTAQLESASDKVGCVLLVEAVEPNATLRLSTIKRRSQRFRSMLSGDPDPGSSENNERKQFLDLINQASSKVLRTAKYEIVSGAGLVSATLRLKFLAKVLKGNRSWPNWLTPLSFSEIYSFARDKYRARVVKTNNVVLVKATTSVDNVPADEPVSELICEELLGWEPFVDEITVLNVSGGHSSLLQEPYVEDLGEQLKNYLA